MEAQAAVDSPKDFGDDARATVSRWISELDLAEKAQASWVKRSEQAIRKYVGNPTEANDVKKRVYPLDWANDEVLKPAVYARTPTPVVLRRFKDDDPVARVTCEVLERSLAFSLDADDFADTMTSIRDNFLLLGRGQARVRYVPRFSKRPSGAPAEAGGEGSSGVDALAADGDQSIVPVQSAGGEVTDDAGQYDAVEWEEAIVDHVHWRDFLHNPARTWREVRWVAFKAYMTRAELVDRFGDEKGKECPLDWKSELEPEQSGKDTQFAKACVYEIWDKHSRKVFWICRAMGAAPLDERPDPLHLRKFFPCPRPLLATCGPDSIIPTPDREYVESQIRDINELTKRIGLLTDALKVRGFYAGTQGEKLTDLLAAETNTIVPIDSFQGMSDGDMSKVVAWWPIDMVVMALKEAIAARQQLIEDVRDLTGIADIMRGDTDPDETATAQQLKSTWGSSRVRDKQKEIARFARDILGIMGEIIAGNFDADTLAKMTGIQLFKDGQEKSLVQNQLQMAAQAAQQMGQPPPPVPEVLQRKFAAPTWADIEMTLRDNATRNFKIDIETDSTIEPNDQQEKQRFVEFVTALGELMAKSLPLVQLEPATMPMVAELIKALVRKFRVGRESEDVIEQCMDQLQARAGQPQPGGQQKPGPNPQAEQAKAQAAVMNAQANQTKAQADAQRVQIDAFRAHSEAQLGAAQIHTEAQTAAADRSADLHMAGQSIQADLQQASMKAVERRFIRDINDQRPLDVHTQ